MDEVVIFDDGCMKPQSKANESLDDDSTESYSGFSDPNFFLAHILSYLETPPHLRKQLFPVHPDLRHGGSLPSLDMPHHIRRDEWCQYREGVTKDVPLDETSRQGLPTRRTYVDTGLRNPVYTQAVIPVDTRVTMKFRDVEKPFDIPTDGLPAEPVAPSAPREEAGYYWGYSVRSATSLSAVLTECPIEGGYDLTIGTSERGSPLSNLTSSKSLKHDIPAFCHLLVVFGGVAGLEPAVRSDKELGRLGVQTPETLFDYWVNLCPGQGSRTIRTEEAVWIGLMGLRELVRKKGKR